MKIRNALVLFATLGSFVPGCASWKREPGNRLVAAIRNIKNPSRDPDEFPIATIEIKDAGLGNRAAPRVLELLDDDDPDVRKWAAIALGQIGAEGSLIIPKLLEKRFDPDPTVRDWVLSALGRARPTNDTVIDVFLERTRDKDPHVRMGAACTLGGMLPQSKRTLPIVLRILMESLNSSDSSTREGAATALGYIGPEAREASPMVRKMACDDDNEFARTVAVTALRQIEGDSDFVISALIELLKCDYPYAIGYAARTLGDIGPGAERAIPALQYILDHPPTKSPAPPAPPAAAGNPSKLLPFSTTPTTGTVGLATLENTYPQLRAEVLEALSRIRPGANKNAHD